jgi:hypothetical protein
MALADGGETEDERHPVRMTTKEYSRVKTNFASVGIKTTFQAAFQR